MQRMLSLAAVAYLLVSCSLLRPRPPEYPKRVLDSGVVVKDLVIPEIGPVAQHGDRVTIEYTMSLSPGEQIDSTYDRGLPIEFVIGAGDVPRGIEEGVVGVRLMGRRRIEVPPEMGYGTTGRPPTIPPDARLLIDLELTGIESPEASSSNGDQP